MVDKIKVCNYICPFYQNSCMLTVILEPQSLAPKELDGVNRISCYKPQNGKPVVFGQECLYKGFFLEISTNGKANGKSKKLEESVD